MDFYFSQIPLLNEKPFFIKPKLSVPPNWELLGSLSLI